MTSNYPETSNFGLTRVGEGDSLQKENFGATDGNFVAIDRVLKVLAGHDHTGGTKLADPTNAPDLTASTSGGLLPAGQTYYYQVSYIDIFGLESAASPEVSITTPPPLGVPTAPALSAETAGGTLGAGIYRYILAARTTGGGLTTTSNPAEVIVDTGTTNRILINLPDLPAGAEALVIYRARPGQTQYYFWKESTDAADVYDDGSIAEDQTVLAPAYNTSSGTNSVTVTLHGGTVPTGVKMWRLYRASSPGVYNGLNLVHQVSEGLTESATEPRPNWIDDGSPLFRGQPRRTSATTAPPPAVGSFAVPTGGSAGQLLAKVDTTDYHTAWVAPPSGSGAPKTYHQSAWAPGTLVIGKTYDIIHSEGPLKASQVAAYFQTPPTTDPNGAQVGFALTGTGQGEFAVGGGAAAMFRDYWADPIGIFAAEDMAGLDPVRIVADTDAAPSNKAVRLAVQSDYVEMIFLDLPQGEYTCYLYVKTEGSASPAAGDLQIRLHNQFTNTDLLSQAVRPLSYAEAGNGYGVYILRFTAPGPQYATTYGPMQELRLRATKMLNDATSYLVDEVNVRTAQGNMNGIVSDPLAIKAVLTDSPNFPLAASLEPVRTFIQVYDGYPPRLYIRQGLETSVQFGWTTKMPTASVAWTASSDQSWCTVTPTSGTDDGADLTVTADMTGFAAGSRHTANITIAASGYTSVVMPIVALMAPSVLGSDANVHVRYFDS